MADTVEHKEDTLLTPDFLRKIEHLSIVAKRVFPGKFRGERRSPKRGSSVEFADYRNYSHGDDFRRVDWNVYARLEKLFLKLFVEEEDLHVYILLDSSNSMSFGSPTKLLYAKKIAAALSYIALSNMDRVGVTVLSGSTANSLAPKRGKQSAFGIFQYLESVSASGEVQLADSVRDFSLRTPRPGLAIVISDFFDEGYRQGINSLLSRKFEVALIHLLDLEETDPSLVGDLVLIDSETSARREITITQTLLRKYQQRFTEFCSDIESFSKRYGCNYLRVTNKSSFDSLLMSFLKAKVLTGKGH